MGTDDRAVRSDLRQFLGVPVLVQMKHPIAVPTAALQALPHAVNTERQWVPVELASGFDETGKVSDPTPVVREIIPYVVIQWIDVKNDQFEMRWLAPLGNGMMVVSTLARLSDAIITRLSEPLPPVPPPPEQPRLVTL